MVLGVVVVCVVVEILCGCEAVWCSVWWFVDEIMCVCVERCGVWCGGLVGYWFGCEWQEIALELCAIRHAHAHARVHTHTHTHTHTHAHTSAHTRTQARTHHSLQAAPMCSLCVCVCVCVCVHALSVLRLG